MHLAILKETTFNFAGTRAPLFDRKEDSYFLLSTRKSWPFDERKVCFEEDHRTVFALEEIPFDWRFYYLKYLVHAIELFIDKPLGFRFYNLWINDRLSSRQKDFAFVDASSAV